MRARGLGAVALAGALACAAPVAADEPSAGSAQRAWGWVATGTGAGFLGVGTYAFFKSRSYADDARYDEYRKTEVPEGEDACDYAAANANQAMVDVCDGDETWSTVFWITAPVGLVLTGTGVVLLATAPTEPARAGWQLRPKTSPRGAALDFTYRF